MNVPTRRIVRALGILGALMAGLVFYGVFILCWPVTIPPLAVPPDPAPGYEEAARMAMASGTDEPGFVRLVCRTSAFLHGQRTSRAFLLMPNRLVWWDRRLRENLPGPQHAYPGFPTHVVGEFIALGKWITSQAAKSAPACRKIDLVLSEADLAVSNEAAFRLANNWKEWPGVTVTETVFPAKEAVPHDMIDPAQPDARVDFVYPRLVEILEKP